MSDGSRRHRVTLMPGDGVGPEIADATIYVLAAAGVAIDWEEAVAGERALVTVATMVGALMLSRAVDDARLSDAMRKAALKHLVRARA